MRIAVTGGQGGLGRALVPYLRSHGHSVMVIDRTAPTVLDDHDEGVSAWVADVRDLGQVATALRGCDAVIHLAGHIWPWGAPPQSVYLDNVVMAYNVLEAAAAVGIERVCQASSVNAIGMAFSRQPRFDYFPVDEEHPSYAEEPYGLSKWILEKQAESFVRSHRMRVASLRFHWLLPSYAEAVRAAQEAAEYTWRHLWAYTEMAEAVRACELSLTADFDGHEAFFIAAPRTADAEPSRVLAARHFPSTPFRAPIEGHASLIDSGKAGRLLGWFHN